jgi:hypothetical protein
MKDCILSLFWPRKDIVGFFEKDGCTKAEVSGLQIEVTMSLRLQGPRDALSAAIRSVLLALPKYSYGGGSVQ